MPRRTVRLVWATRLVFLALTVALPVYLVAVGLDKADKIASTVAAVVALLALTMRYLPPALARTTPSSPVGVPGTGAVAIGGDNSARIGTDVAGVAPSSPTPPTGNGVWAGGPGSVAIGGNNTAPIRTEVTGTPRKRR